MLKLVRELNFAQTLVMGRVVRVALRPHDDLVMRGRGSWISDSDGKIILADSASPRHGPPGDKTFWPRR